MRQYKKTYEDVFSGERSLKKCDLSEVSTDEGYEINEYIGMVRDAMVEYRLKAFDSVLKTQWLFRRFCYKGTRKSKPGRNGHIDHAFGVFMKCHVGTHHGVITREYILGKVATYVDDFFPDFDARNPFKEKMEYPYKYVGFEYLFAVYLMPERLEILDYCEKQKMTYGKFLDYLINYVNCYNDEHGKDIYEFSVASWQYLSYVKVKKQK